MSKCPASVRVTSASRLAVRLSVTRLLRHVNLVLIACACTDFVPDDNVSANIDIASITEIGVVPRPPGHGGRDVGFSGILRGRSVWIFGDTFLPKKADDGLRWRSSSWSWTKALSSDDGIGDFEHALGTDGMAMQLLPHTSQEASYNIAHEGHYDCPAKIECGSRQTPWPNALVTDQSQQHGIIFYLNMETGPDGQWDFRSISGSVAIWTDPDAPAVRIEPPLFGAEEPNWGSAAVLIDEYIYVYAAEFKDNKHPCLLARVPFKEARDRNRYRFWAGEGKWSEDWHEASPVFDCAPFLSVHYNAYLRKYVAYYMPGMSEMITIRTAIAPQGPWSDPHAIGKGTRAYENWDYALIAHPEFSRENGRSSINRVS